MNNDLAPQEQQALEHRLRQKEKEIYSIQRIGKALSSTLQLDELLELIIREITDLMSADRGTLFVVDHQRQEIWSKIALKAEVKEIRLPIGKGISGHVAQTGDTINIPDAYQDARFDPSTDKRTGYHTHSILCMPVREPHGQEGRQKIIGVIQLLNKSSGSQFTADDEALLEALAAQVAISIANSQLYHHLEKKYQEIDLLYDVEQMLNTVYELPEIVAQLLSRTVDHLQARFVLTLLPLEDKYLFAGIDSDHQRYYETTNAISLGMMNLMQHPSMTSLVENWPDIQAIFRLEDLPDPQERPPLFTGVQIDSDNSGLLLALDVSLGRMQQFEDERKMLELVGQKISRAQELFSLRDNLIRQERLSAIGKLMSTIVHDIRGPVNTIYGFVDLMEDKTTTDSERLEFGQIIREEIQSTMNMITEVLDFAKGKTNILARKTNVKDILKRFQPRLEQMCQKNQTQLSVNIDSRQMLYADVEKISRVFYNISKNALEAMGEGGELRFSVNDQQDMVLFEFSDNGPGIPREIQSRLFDSFVTSGKEKGTGLGLAIVKKIIDEHHGEIDIDSREGEGATFRLKLPVHAK